MSFTNGHSSALASAAATLLAVSTMSACGSHVESTDAIGTAENQLVGASIQACVIGTTSVRIGQRVTTSGGMATDSLSMESGAVANGGANINNVGGATVRISGAVINGTVSIAGAAPSAANGQLVNGGRINGTVITGAGIQATLPTRTVTAGTTPVTVNSNDPARTVAPGSYGGVTVNGSTVVFVAGTYNLSSLTINSGNVRFDTGAGPITVNVVGSVSVNGGVFVASNPALVSVYSAATTSNAITINAGVNVFPATLEAPNGGVNIGSRNAVQGCVGGKYVNIEPDSSIRGTAEATGCADGAREGFVDVSAFPDIAGCSGGFTIPGVMAANPGTAPTCPSVVTYDTVTPACNRMGGDDGLNPSGTDCNVADLCAAGWHVCATASDIESHSPTGCEGATQATDPPLFFVSRQPSTGCGICATGTNTGCNSASCATDCAPTELTANDLFGCGNLGAVSWLSECGPINAFSDNLCGAFAGSNWTCNDGEGWGFCEGYVVTHAGPTFGGALCCRD